MKAIPWLRAPKDPRHRLALLGEEAVAKFLRKSGCRILERNWMSPAGEIDVIAERKGAVQFVEVKTRIADEFGEPEEAVNDTKRSRIQSAARLYLKQFSREPAEVSFGVAAVIVTKDGMVQEIRWDEKAF